MLVDGLIEMILVKVLFVNFKEYVLCVIIIWLLVLRFSVLLDWFLKVRVGVLVLFFKICDWIFVFNVVIFCLDIVSVILFCDW